MSAHKNLLKRHQQVIPNWVALNYAEPIQIVDGKGSFVTDGEGNQYLDCFGGILTTMTGYGVPEIVEAIQRQAEKMIHTSTLYLNEPMIELAEKIVGLTEIENAKVFFTTSGTEATDTALLLATLYRNSNEVLAMRSSYHGRSFSAQAVTGTSSWTSTTYSGLSVNFVHGSNRYRSPFIDLDDAAYIEACTNDLRDIINVTTSGNVAALIAEPMLGVGGFDHGPDGLFASFDEVLKETGILFIADEVQTGWGRTGENFWGHQAHGVVPDIMTFAKGVGNGMSVGGVVARAEIMDCLTANSISTFGGNPLCAVGAMANIDYLLEHDLQSNALKMGNLLMNGLNDIANDCDWIGNLRGKGLAIAIEAVKPGTKAPSPEAASKMMEETRERGLLIGKGGTYGNCLRIAPPLSISEDEVGQALSILAESANKVKA